VTTYGVFRFDPTTKRAVLSRIFPEVDLETVKKETGWPLAAADDLETAPLPTLEELALIRKFDPRGYWTGQK
jgi:glutaconate CoA-transferase subunit B